MKSSMNVHPVLYEDGYLDVVYLPLPSAGKYLAELEKLRMPPRQVRVSPSPRLNAISLPCLRGAERPPRAR